MAVLRQQREEKKKAQPEYLSLKLYKIIFHQGGKGRFHDWQNRATANVKKLQEHTQRTKKESTK